MTEIDRLLEENRLLRAENENLRLQLSIVETTQRIHSQRPITELPNVHEIRFEQREWIK